MEVFIGLGQSADQNAVVIAGVCVRVQANLGNAAGEFARSNGLFCFLLTADERLELFVAAVGVEVGLGFFQSADERAGLVIACPTVRVALGLFQPTGKFARGLIAALAVHVALGHGLAVTLVRVRMQVDFRQRTDKHAVFVVAVCGVPVHNVIGIAADRQAVGAVAVCTVHVYTQPVKAAEKLAVRHGLRNRVACIGVHMFFQAADDLLFQCDGRQDERVGGHKYHRAAKYANNLQP